MPESVESPEVIAAKADAQRQINDIKSAKDKEVSDWKTKHDTVHAELTSIKPKYTELIAKESVYSEFFDGEKKANNDQSSQGKQPVATVDSKAIDIKVLKETYVKAGVPENVLVAAETEKEVRLVAGLYRELKPQPAKPLDQGRGSSAGNAPDLDKMNAYDLFKTGLEQRDKK